MKYILNLHNAEHTIDLCVSHDKKEIIEKVQEDFRTYTKGTHKDYRNADKLCYLDGIREGLHMDFDEHVKEFIKHKIDCEQNIGMFDINRFEVNFDYEFAAEAYQAGSKRFYKSGESLNVYNNLATIVKAVMDFED